MSSDTTDEASSGSDVPPATSVMAMTDSLMPSLRAISVALFQEHVAAENQPGESSGDHDDRQPEGRRLFGAGIGGHRFGPFRGADREPHQRNVERHHDDAVDAADSVRRPRTYQAVRSDGQQNQRRGHAEGNVAPDVAPGEGQRPDQGADAEDQKDVEEVRADDVSDRHVAVARRGREYRDDQFGRRVPTATIVRPMMNSGTRKRCATAAEPSVRKFAPARISPSPTISSRMSIIYASRIRLTAMSAMPATTP